MTTQESPIAAAQWSQSAQALKQIARAASLPDALAALTPTPLPRRTNRGVAPTPIEERVAQYVVEDSNGCWLWTGTLKPAGYGYINVAERCLYVHRWTYERLVGPIPKGLELDHLCRVRNCCNPAHLEPVTHAENVRRGEAPTAQNAKKTKCPQGHDYTVESNGTRSCRTCKYERRNVLKRLRAAAEGRVLRGRVIGHALPTRREPSGWYCSCGYYLADTCRAAAVAMSEHRVSLGGSS